MNEFASAFGCDVTILEYGTPSHNGSPYDAAERRAQVWAEAVALEQALACHGVFGVEVDEHEVRVVARFDSPLACDAEPRGGIGRGQRGRALHRNHVEQHAERRLYARHAAPDPKEVRVFFHCGRRRRVIAADNIDIAAHESAPQRLALL